MEMNTAERWAKPKEVSKLDMAFGTKAMDLMPPYDEIPREFRSGSNKWNRVASAWFFGGLKNAKFTPKEGIDQNAALKHLRAIIGSFEPPHEHKEAGVAYLASLWFDEITLARKA